VHGVSEFDLQRRDEARRALESFAPQLHFRMLGDMPLSAIEDAVRKLPRDSLVLLVSMVRDAEGRALVGRDYAERLRKISPVPIYGTFASHMERGTMGGAITDYRAIGRTTSALVAQALSGTLPPRPVATETPDTPLVVNWRALEHWDIPA